MAVCIYTSIYCFVHCRASIIWRNGWLAGTHTHTNFDFVSLIFAPKLIGDWNMFKMLFINIYIYYCCRCAAIRCSDIYIYMADRALQLGFIWHGIQSPMSRLVMFRWFLIFGLAYFSNMLLLHRSKCEKNKSRMASTPPLASSAKCYHRRTYAFLWVALSNNAHFW